MLPPFQIDRGVVHSCIESSNSIPPKKSPHDHTHTHKPVKGKVYNCNHLHVHIIKRTLILLTEKKQRTEHTAFAQLGSPGCCFAFFVSHSIVQAVTHTLQNVPFKPFPNHQLLSLSVSHSHALYLTLSLASAAQLPAWSFGEARGIHHTRVQLNWATDRKKKDTHDVRIAVRNFANTHQPYATHIGRAIAYMRKFWLASPGCILNGMELRKHPEPFPLFALPCSSLPVPCAPIRSEHFILSRCHRAAVGFPGPAGLPNEIKRCTHERNRACLCVYVCEKVHRQKRNAVHYPATRMTEFTSWVMVKEGGPGVRREGIRIESAASQPCTSD